MGHLYKHRVCINIKKRSKLKLLTHAVSKEYVLDSNVPALVSFICSFDVNFRRLLKGLREHELALTLVSDK